MSSLDYLRQLQGPPIRQTVPHQGEVEREIQRRQQVAASLDTERQGSPYLDPRYRDIIHHQANIGEEDPLALVGSLMRPLGVGAYPSPRLEPSILGVHNPNPARPAPDRPWLDPGDIAVNQRYFWPSIPDHYSPTERDVVSPEGRQYRIPEAPADPRGPATRDVYSLDELVRHEGRHRGMSEIRRDNPVSGAEQHPAIYGIASRVASESGRPVAVQAMQRRFEHEAGNGSSAALPSSAAQTRHAENQQQYEDEARQWLNMYRRPNQ